MPLDGVVDKLNQRRRPAPTARGFVETSQAARMGASSPYVSRMIEIIDKPGGVSAADIKEGFVALAQGVVDVEDQVRSVGEALGRKPESFDDIKSEIATLRSSLATLVKAIQGIKLPDVKVPDYRDPDLSPIQEAIGDLKIMVASMERVAEVAAPPPQIPQEWTFDVKRSQGGYIKSIEARAK